MPAIQAWSYSLECDELRNLYSNLLANSMLREKQADAHPGYVEIIKQLHPNEAKLFKAMLDQQKRTFAVFELRACDKLTPTRHTVHYKHFLCINIEGEEIIPPPANLENLKRLGLIDIDYTLSIVDQTPYLELEKHSAIVRWKEQITSQDNDRTCHKGVIYITPFGMAFAAICIECPVNAIHQKEAE